MGELSTIHFWTLNNAWDGLGRDKMEKINLAAVIVFTALTVIWISISVVRGIFFDSPVFAKWWHRPAHALASFATTAIGLGLFLLSDHGIASSHFIGGLSGEIIGVASCLAMTLSALIMFSGFAMFIMSPLVDDFQIGL